MKPEQNDPAIVRLINIINKGDTGLLSLTTNQLVE
jgi:hypothetical protein